jgi:hypothetical protein
MELDSQIRERVAAGAQFLNGVNQSWRSSINWDELNMASPWKDIAGNIYTDHGKKPGDDIKYSGYMWLERLYDRAWCVERGFYTEDEHAKYEAEWKKHKDEPIAEPKAEPVVNPCNEVNMDGTPINNEGRDREIFKQRIKVGAAWCDSMWGKEWPRKIDLNLLDLMSVEKGVLAMLSAHKGRAYSQFKKIHDEDWLTDRGFRTDDGQYAMLTRGWKAYVADWLLNNYKQSTWNNIIPKE